MLPQSPRAVVTGAGSGLGRAFVLEIAKRKGRVLATDVDMKGVEETVRLATALGADVVAERCDVTRAEDVDRLATVADERFGGVDIVVNNAGVAVSGDVGTVPLADWNWIVQINLMGVVHGCHTFAPRLRKQGRGHIINVASAAGLVATPGLAPYNATKFAVVGLSEALFLELRSHGVGVTVLCPTFFPTNIATAGRGDPSGEHKKIVAALMSRAKIDAAGVARAALDSADAGQLYCLPMNDARAAWALKRLSPSLWYDRVGPAVMSLAKRKFSR